jgi:hypothetical protein
MPQKASTTREDYYQQVDIRPIRRSLWGTMETSISQIPAVDTPTNGWLDANHDQLNSCGFGNRSLIHTHLEWDWYGLRMALAQEIGTLRCIEHRCGKPAICGSKSRFFHGFSTSMLICLRVPIHHMPRLTLSWREGLLTWPCYFGVSKWSFQGPEWPQTSGEKVT